MIETVLILAVPFALLFAIFAVWLWARKAMREFSQGIEMTERESEDEIYRLHD